MRIGFYSCCVNHIEAKLWRGFHQIGVEAERYLAYKKYDYVLLFNQTAHGQEYCYGTLDVLEDYRFAFIDCAEYGWFNRMRPNWQEEYYSAFAPGSLRNHTKNMTEQVFLLLFLQGKSFPYFLREFLVGFPYPPTYYPIDYPITVEPDMTPPDREQYLARPVDLFLSWGISHPFRANLTEEVRQAGVRTDINIIQDPHGGRLPYDEYVGRMARAKATVSYDGYGISAFRESEALCRTLLFRGGVPTIQRCPLYSGVNCVEYKVIDADNGSRFMSSDIGPLVRSYLQDPERCYEMYHRGYGHGMDYYTEAATARYILRTLANHDWNTPTPLLLTS